VSARLLQFALGVAAGVVAQALAAAWRWLREPAAPGAPATGRGQGPGVKGQGTAQLRGGA
jgi:hypothetical protein